jgi:hypothetical protein
LSYDRPVRGVRHEPSGQATVTRAEVVQAWLLSRVEDRAGNFYTLEYEVMRDDRGALEVLPRTLRYGGHVSGPPATRMVRFTYERRPEPQIAYVSGLALSMTQRLRRIEMSAPTAPGAAAAVVWQYELGYRDDSSTGRSLLHWVQRCHDGQCLPATRFEWQPGSLQLAATPIRTAGGDRPESLRVADVDGDGADDLVARGRPAGATRTEFYARTLAPCTQRQSTVSGGSSGWDPGYPYGIPDPTVIDDATVERIDEEEFLDDATLPGAALVSGATHQPRVLLPLCHRTLAVPRPRSEGWHLADLDLDGRAELITDETTNLAFLWRVDGTALGSSVHLSLSAASRGPGAVPFLVDLDGDGGRDLAYQPISGGIVPVHRRLW